jgi:hypothetical protein
MVRHHEQHDTAVNELNKQMDLMTSNSDADDPFTILAPFVKKEITPTYVQGKIELLIDDTSAWISGATVTPPVISFADLKEKLIKQNKHMITQLESAVSQMESTQQEVSSQPSDDSMQTPAINIGDIQKFLKSDFTIPIGTYLFGFKQMIQISQYVLFISGGLLAFNLLLIVLIAPGVQSKLRWVGSTLLFTAIWNIPGALIGVGSAVMIVPILTQHLHGIAAVVAKPFTETLITPILLTYTRITGGVVITLFIVSIGMLILSFIATPVEVAVSPVPQKSNKKKK